MTDQQGFKDLPAEDASFLHSFLQSLQSLDWINLGWFAGIADILILWHHV